MVFGKVWQTQEIEPSSPTSFQLGLCPKLITCRGEEDRNYFMNCLALVLRLLKTKNKQYQIRPQMCNLLKSSRLWVVLGNPGWGVRGEGWLNTKCLCKLEHKHLLKLNYTSLCSATELEQSGILQPKFSSCQSKSAAGWRHHKHNTNNSSPTQ